MSKTIIQIRSGDFEYINQEFDREMAPVEAVGAFRALSGAFRSGIGLNTKEWNRIVDAKLKGNGTFTAEEWEVMNEKQRWMLQEIKKSDNRK